MSQFADFEYMGNGSAHTIVRFVSQNAQDIANCRRLRAVAGLHARAQQPDCAALADCVSVMEPAASRTSYTVFCWTSEGLHDGDEIEHCFPPVDGECLRAHCAER